jgi:hypothetical protein
MVRRRVGWYQVVALVAAAVVAGAAIAQAIRERSLEPIWMVGWIPAVLVATFGARTTGRCSSRSRGRSRS